MAYHIICNFAVDKGSVLLCHLGGLFLDFQLDLIDFGFSLLVVHFCLAKSVVGTLSHLSLNLTNLERICENKPPKISMIAEAKKICVQNLSGGFFTFV